MARSKYTLFYLLSFLVLLAVAIRGLGFYVLDNHPAGSIVTPFSFLLLYMVALIITSGVWWQIHMWLGAPCLAGVVGLGLSYLIAPPHGPAAEHMTSG